MRKIIELQSKFWGTDISEIQFDLKSRDETTKMLIGLQVIYNDKEIFSQVIDILRETIPIGTDIGNGRPGMDLWKILVLGVLRLNSNLDYDKVKEIADNHKNVRLMLQLSSDDLKLFPLQTIKDNVSLLTTEVLNKINQVFIQKGHKELGKKQEEKLKGKCDSYVVETNVSYPTDIKLLYDAVRKAICLIAVLCSKIGVTEWRWHHSYIVKVRKFYNALRKLRHSTSNNEDKKKEKAEEIVRMHQEYIDLAESFMDDIQSTISGIKTMYDVKPSEIEEIEYFVNHAERQIDQIFRRVIQGETIPHDEKVFSIFEEHTEWISKGKAGVPQELGVKVCIIEDQFGFILNHRVMQHESDQEAAVPITYQTQEKFPDFKICSYDKGFWNPENRIELNKILDAVILPKKGRLSEDDRKIEESEEFIRERRQHPAIESAINALEAHGLDLCPDHGIESFKRYVSLGVVARNIQVLGHVVQQKELKKEQRIEKYRKTWHENRIAA
jgi:hypothetical protein